MKYDLHTHTKYSDGDLDVQGNIDNAIKLGLDGIAITDHDNIESWKDIDSINTSIDLIKGVELSTFYNKENVHILGYYKNEGSYEELDTFLKELKVLREKRVNKIIELLHQFDIYLDYDEVLKYADGSVGRVHIAQAIMEKYPDRNYTMDYIFDNFIGNGQKAYVPTNDFQTIDAVSLLRRNNCLVVLAHPLLISKNSYKDVLNLGFDGVETYYPYDETDYSEILDYVQDKDYIRTGGSDYHGPVTRNTMGMEYLEGDLVDKFLQSINK